MKRTVLAVAVKDIEKRYQPTRCYKFVLEVTWTDKSRYVIYRSFSEFYELHMFLTDAFPIEAGEINSDERVLPKLSGGSLFSRNEVLRVAEKRRGEIADYCNRLVTLPPRVAEFPKLLEFFELRDDDLNIPGLSKTKKDSALKSIGKKLKKKKKDRGNDDDTDFQITGPLQLQVYQVVAPYKSLGKGQINLQLDDQVDVIDKNANGWWYVACNGVEGWAPATYLEKLHQSEDHVSDNSEKDEIPCMAGELFLSLKDYKGEFEDELSFDKSVVLEVLNKVLDGWWIASYNSKVGYVPSTYLMPYNNPYLTNKSSSLPAQNSPVMPTPRRQSIKNGTATLPPPAKRDLLPYRRATEKRRQRSVKVQKPSTDVMNDLPLSLSKILESEDEHGYLRPSSTEEDELTSATDSMCSDYVDPNCFIPPNHIQTANKPGVNLDLSKDASAPSYRAPSSPTVRSPNGGGNDPSPRTLPRKLNTQTSNGSAHSLPRNPSDSQLPSSRPPPPPLPSRSESDNTLTNRPPVVPPHKASSPPFIPPHNIEGPEDDYEPIHDYDKPPIEELKDIPPSYQAPTVPASLRASKIENTASVPHTAARTRKVTPPVHGTEQSWPAPPPPMTRPPPVSEIHPDDTNDYELVYDESDFRSQLKPVTATKSMMRPPPKPITPVKQASAGKNGAKILPKSPKPEVPSAGTRTLPGQQTDKKMINIRVPPPKPAEAQLTRLSKTDTDDYEYNSVGEIEQISGISSRRSPPLTKSSELNEQRKPPSPPAKKSSLPEENPANLLARLKPVNKGKPDNNLRAQSPKPLKNATLPKTKTDFKPPTPPRSPRNFRSDEINSSSQATLKVENNNISAGDGEEGLIYEEFLIKPSQMKGQSNAQVRAPKKSK